MAVSVARVLQGGLPHTTVGAQKQTVTDVTMDDDYTTGGKAVTAAQLGLSAVYSGQVEVGTSASGADDFANVALIPQTNGSVLLKSHISSGAESSSSADQTGVVLRVTAQGY